MFPTSIAYKNEYYLDSAYPLCYTIRIIRKWAYSDMAGVWDSSMKRLVGINPQAFVTWLLGDAQVVQELSGHLNRAIDIDILYEIILLGQRVALHIEFQRYRDTNMAERVWEYNVFATRKYSCTVISFVIYLKVDGKIAESPYIRDLLGSQQIHRFDFFNVKLWETSTEELMDIGLVGLLPLLPLTKEGGKREVIEEVVTKLLQVEDKGIQKNLLTITFTLSSLALDVQEDKTWLLRRFKLLQDIIRDTEIYQYIMQEGREEDMEKERQRELQGVRQMLLQMLLARVKERFTVLTPLAQQITKVTVRNESMHDLALTEDFAEVADDL